MNIGVISYSLTGNNDTLAARVAALLGAALIKVAEERPRTNGTIAFDMLLGRTPRTQPAPDKQDDFDLIVYVAPVWMGQAASPMRAYLKRIKTVPRRYAFVSISGGALNDNPKLADSLQKQTGQAPDAVVDLHIADLLPPGSKPTASDTSAYRLAEEGAQKLAETVVQRLKGIVAKA